METYDLEEAAARGGVSVDELSRFVALGIIEPGADGRFPSGAVRRASMVHSVVAAGIPLDGLAAAVRSGQVSFEFLDAPAYERLSAFSGVTFAQLAKRSGAPVELLMQIREAAGSAVPGPDDLVRDEELPYAALIEISVKGGLTPAGIQQLMRVQGDSLRRMAETEAALWQAEVIGPAMAAGKQPNEIFGGEFADRMSAQLERAIIGMYHLQQTQAWGVGLVAGLETMMAAAGLHSRLEHPPAMCFLDITGYTRLTQERGDAAAADLADQLGKLVQQSSIRHGGRPVKWLGDGVMFHFPNPGPGVRAALEMCAEVTQAGLPPAHVGLHAGSVIFQQGDYYGQTVNLASRIADYAQGGQVLVSQAVVDASAGTQGLAFQEIGPVELKGVSGAMSLYTAHRVG